MAGRVRTVSAWVAAVLAAVLLPLGLVSSWVAAVAADTDRYVDTVTPLASDPVIQEVAIERLQQEALGLIDFDTQRGALEQLLLERGASERVRNGAAAFAGAVRAQLEELVRRTVRTVVESDNFVSAWSAANRSAHEEMVAVLEGQEDALVDERGRVSIQLGTVLNAVVAELEDRGVAIAGQLPEVRTSFPLMKASDLSRAQRGYDLLEAVGFWLPIAWLVLALVAILLARDRRRGLRRVAIGGLLGLVGLGLALRLARDQVTSGVADPAVLRSVWDIVMADLRNAMRTGIIVSLVLLVVAWILGPSRSAVAVRDAEAALLARAREGVGPVQSRRAGAVAVAGIAAAVLVVLAW